MITRIKNIFTKNEISKTITGKDNVVELKTTSLKDINLKITGNNNRVFVGNSTFIHTIVAIIGNNNKLIVRDGCHIGGKEIYLVGNDNIIEIGNNTTINHACLLAGEGSLINIGEDCLFSSYIDIRTTDSHSIVDLTTNRRINQAKNIEIKDHVWLGIGVQILKGTTLGSGCIIGSKSVVTDDVPENCLTVGNPAKVIRRNVGWSRDLI